MRAATTAQRSGRPSCMQRLLALDADAWRGLLSDGGPAGVRALRLAARQGVPRAQAILAQRLLSGQGAAADAGEAVHWFRLAADGGDADAMNMLGRCHENGWGMKPDAQMAVYWYRLAAREGLDWGMYNLANLLMNGSGAPADRPRALALYRQAAALGHAKSVNIIGRFYEEGWEVGRDVAMAFELYRQAADGGDFRACYNYGRLLAERGLVPQALAILRRIPALATPAFMCNLFGWLRDSPVPELRGLAREAAFVRVVPIGAAPPGQGA